MRVYCRFAPLKENYGRSDQPLRVTLASPSATSGGQLLTVADPATGANASVSCSGVYFPSDTQGQANIFEDVVKPLIKKAKRGEKGSVLCYGQTSTGKTHTIFGPDGGNTSLYTDHSQRGIVPRLADELFSVKDGNARVNSVDVSLCEIYNEVVTDLVAQLHYDIDGQPRKTQYKSVEKGKVLRSLHRMTCSNPQELNELLLTLSEMRLLYSTENNAKSSRSHVVIQLNLGLESGLGGQLTIADLAGSESLKGTQSLENGGSTGISLASCSDIFASSCVKMRLKSQAVQRRQETKNINTSLFALKRVISSLHSKSKHISYLESMLTTVLENCLDADAALIACCSSSGRDAAETLATLRFAKEASGIQLPEAVVARQRAEVLRDVLRDDTRCASSRGHETRISKSEQVLSEPSSVSVSTNGSCHESLPGLYEKDDRDILIQNLKSLATDQREHIAALEAEIERMQDILLNHQAREKSELAGFEEGLATRSEAMQKLEDKIERLVQENSQLRAQLVAQRRYHNKQAQMAEFEIRCLKNELALLDECGASTKRSGDSFSSPSRLNGAPLEVIEMEETPAHCSAAARSRVEQTQPPSMHEDRPVAISRAVSAVNTSEVIKDVSAYIASVRAQLGRDSGKCDKELPAEALDPQSRTSAQVHSAREHTRHRVVRVFSPDSKSRDVVQ